MDPISLIVLVVVIGGLSIVVDRRWQARQAQQSKVSEAAPIEAEASTPQVESESLLAKTSSQAQALGSQALKGVQWLGEKTSSRTQALGSQAVAQAQALRERIPLARPKATLAPDFRAWVAKASADEPELAKWLASLSDDQFGDFTETVSDFCVSTGFELEWLVHEEFGSMPQLGDGAAQVVTNYCRSCYQAALAQTALELYRAYREYTQNPSSRRGRAYGEALLDHLLAAGLTSVSLADFLGASAKDKQEQVYKAIQSAAEKDPAAFGRILKSLASEETESSPQNASSPAAAPA